MKPLILVILDGWGIEKKEKNNAVKLADTPNMDSYWKTKPSAILGASGLSVGLPDGQMGNSEVGHLNIGAGRIVHQDFLRINKAVKDSTFFENKFLVKAAERVKNSDNKLHLMGLIGPGGVHSHSNHLYALLELAKKVGLRDKQVVIHCFLDGRDTPQKSALSFVKELEKKIKEIGIGVVATVMGRYYAMDRDKRWDRTQKAYDVMTKGKGKDAKDLEDAIEKAYGRGETDEFVYPTLIGDDYCISDGDSIVFFNFRPDRARQITQVFTDEDFEDFDRKLLDVFFVCMTEYDKKFDLPVAFPPIIPKNTFGEVISKAGLHQLRIAETEKYAHVTFFFSGGVEDLFDGEDRCLVPSPKVATYDLKPEMSVYEVTDKVVEKLRSRKYDVIILNFANPDMVGHTGDLDAAIKACEAVDECLGAVIEKVSDLNGIALITADHGNAENMSDEEGNPHTFHTINPVPFILIGADVELREEGILADISPTMLDLLDIEKPSEMKGDSLITK